MSQVGLRKSWTAFKFVWTRTFGAGIQKAVLCNLAASVHCYTVHLPAVAESLKMRFYHLQKNSCFSTAHSVKFIPPKSKSNKEIEEDSSLLFPTFIHSFNFSITTSCLYHFSTSAGPHMTRKLPKLPLLLTLPHFKCKLIFIQIPTHILPLQFQSIHCVYP